MPSTFNKFMYSVFISCMATCFSSSWSASHLKTIRCVLHGTHTPTGDSREKESERNRIYCCVPNGILFSIFRKYITPFGMFLSYIIARFFSFSISQWHFPFIGATIHRRIFLFKFPKLSRRGPNTKLNLIFISLTFAANSFACVYSVNLILFDGLCCIICSFSPKNHSSCISFLTNIFRTLEKFCLNTPNTALVDVAVVVTGEHISKPI